MKLFIDNAPINNFSAVKLYRDQLEDVIGYVPMRGRGQRGSGGGSGYRDRTWKETGNHNMGSETEMGEGRNVKT